MFSGHAAGSLSSPAAKVVVKSSYYSGQDLSKKAQALESVPCKFTQANFCLDQQLDVSASVCMCVSLDKEVFCLRTAGGQNASPPPPLPAGTQSADKDLKEPPI